MASIGPVAEGTDGTDFYHRQKVASHYQISAINKTRLKFCIVMHYLLFFVLLVKLAEDILDRLDIFILELEELYIPKPRLWEWLWSGSLIFTWTGLKAIRRNQVTSLKIYTLMTFLFAVCPVIYALCYYFSDLWTFINTRDLTKIQEVWQGYPVALVWYSFLVVALQIHFFQLWFALKLIGVWTLKRIKKSE